MKHKNNFFLSFKDRKAQGLSFNVIITAAIALVVLIVILVIFRGKTTAITKDLDSCFSKGGTCLPNLDSGAKNAKCLEEIFPKDLCSQKPKAMRCCISLG